MSVSVDKAEQIISGLRDLVYFVFSMLDPWFAKEPGVRAFSPESGEWNIDQILEHVSLVNHYLMLIIDKGARKAVRRTDRAAIERELENYELTGPLMEEIGINNSFEWECPGHMIPSGKNPPGQIQDTLLEQKSRLMDCLSMLKEGEGVLSRTHMSVHSLGKLDVYQYIYFLLKHAQRHIQHMEEIEKKFNGQGRTDSYR
jgi:hypothetical protein